MSVVKLDKIKIHSGDVIGNIIDDVNTNLDQLVSAINDINGGQGVIGPQGERGEQGQPGRDGAPGPQGEQGIPGRDGVTGATGPQGLKGDTGAAGKDGVGLKGFASGYVDAGQFVTLDNLKFTVTTSNNRGLSCATVSGTATLSISATFGYINGVGGNSTSWPGANYTTTPSGSWFNYHFPNAGDGCVFLANDYTNKKFYRITLMIGPSYTNNFISIERLA